MDLRLNGCYRIAACVDYYTITHKTCCFFYLFSYFCAFPGNAQLPCSAEMLRQVRRHSCSGDSEPVLAFANISVASCTVCTFTCCCCIWPHVEIILPGNQQILQHSVPTYETTRHLNARAQSQKMTQSNQFATGTVD